MSKPSVKPLHKKSISSAGYPALHKSSVKCSTSQELPQIANPYYYNTLESPLALNLKMIMQNINNIFTVTVQYNQNTIYDLWSDQTVLFTRCCTGGWSICILVSLHLLLPLLILVQPFPTNMSTMIKLSTFQASVIVLAGTSSSAGAFIKSFTGLLLYFGVLELNLWLFEFAW